MNAKSPGLAFIYKLFSKAPVFGSTQKSSEIEDPWSGSSGCYVGRYKGEINSIAQQLGDDPNIFSTRFNPSTKRGEICCKYRRYSSDGFEKDIVFIAFEVHGSHCCANVVRVLSPHQLDQKTKDLIQRIFESTKLKIEFIHFL